MEATIVTALIDDIVQAVYPKPESVRERHLLAQLLHLLAYLARRKPKDRERSVEASRALIEKLRQGQLS
jgi:hypothetical protein